MGRKAKADAALIQAALSGEQNNVLAMLNQFDIAASDAEGNNPLIAAACGGHLSLVEALCERGAPLEAYVRISNTAGLRVP